ncbi:hypothetical protein KSP40_PGU004514 [Platanthera guangdongensis]|uniref:Uncharacterized protein n=1 Tax=Platanthera guangdongensis TaxID=2320717 RepID=A0ABR2MML3_9ASPA
MTTAHVRMLLTFTCPYISQPAAKQWQSWKEQELEQKPVSSHGFSTANTPQFPSLHLFSSINHITINPPPQGYNIELTALASKVRVDVRRCCCVVSGGAYKNLLFFPAIQLIKNRYPGVQLDVVTSPRGKQAYEIDKNVRWADAYDPDDYFPVPAEYVDMLGLLRNRYYDLMVSTKLAGFGHAAFLFMSSARDKVSSDDCLAGKASPTRNFPREPVPPLQAKTYDTEGEYVSYWLPELQSLPREARNFPGSSYIKQIVPLKFDNTTSRQNRFSREKRRQ